MIKLQKSDVFCKNILQHLGCSKYDNYFKDAMDIIHKKVVDFSSVFSNIVIPQILIKHLLHASHDLLEHVGATKLYHFPKCLIYFQSTRRKLHEYVRSCHKCQIMSLQKPNFIDSKTLQKFHKTTYLLIFCD